MSESLAATFRQLTTPALPPGAGEPFPHQLAVADALLGGRRVVLRAPVASGKTLAAWFPWLAARAQRYDFPPSLLHALPGGVCYHDMATRLRAVTAPLGLSVGVQTESDAYDPFLLSDAIVTSADYLLGIALHRPIGLHPGLSNINAGALLGAYLVFDEFPALISRDALVLWLGLLRQYYPATPCLFSTSVWPRALASRMAELLGAELIDAGDTHIGGRRIWSQERALNAETILRRHRGRTIVVCNTVRGAQTLYRAMRRAQTAGAGRPCELLLLHQYQFATDRRPIEARVAELFGRDAGDTSAVLVTTSCIKSGPDLTAETLITDPAPPDALLRRAGHCARVPGSEGRVIVAAVTEQTPGDAYPAPPWPLLLAHLTDDTLKTSGQELAALDAVWDEARPEHLPDTLRDLPTDAEADAAPRRVMAGVDPFPRHLFTRVGTCLHRVPETVHDPFELERFSLAASSLERGHTQWQASGCPGEWFALAPRWPHATAQAPSWSLVREGHEFRAAARLIVLNAEAVSYDPVIGLELCAGTAYQSRRLPEQHTTWSPFDQHVQRYDEHAARTLAAYEQLAPWYRYVLRRLGVRWQIPLVQLEQWARLCILWHDAGKLTAEWQRAARRWQAETMRRALPEGLYARVDYQPRRDGRYPCPGHACTSARALARPLAMLLSPHDAVHAGTIAALAHHHGLGPAETTDLTPHPDAWALLLEVAAPVVDTRELRRLDRVGWTQQTRGLPEVPTTPPDDPDAWMAYSLLARAIRLADREVALGQE